MSWGGPWSDEDASAAADRRPAEMERTARGGATGSGRAAAAAAAADDDGTEVLVNRERQPWRSEGQPAERSGIRAHEHIRTEGETGANDD